MYINGDSVDYYKFILFLVIAPGLIFVLSSPNVAVGDTHAEQHVQKRDPKSMSHQMIVSQKQELH